MQKTAKEIVGGGPAEPGLCRCVCSGWLSLAGCLLGSLLSLPLCSFSIDCSTEQLYHRALALFPLSLVHILHCRHHSCHLVCSSFLSLIYPLSFPPYTLTHSSLPSPWPTAAHTAPSRLTTTRYTRLTDSRSCLPILGARGDGCLPLLFSLLDCMLPNLHGINVLTSSALVIP